MMPEIEKGIPLPEGRRGRKKLYPFGEMEIGDSFVVPVNSQTLSMYKMIGGYTRHLKPKKFIARKNEDVIRVWRIE